jgi:hypothetical protein
MELQRGRGPQKSRAERPRPPSGAPAHPALRLIAGEGQLRSVARRARSERRRTTVQLLRLEDKEHHGLAVFSLEGERWRWPAGSRRGRTYRGRLKKAAPHALTPTPANASAQKARVNWRRPSDSKTIR